MRINAFREMSSVTNMSLQYIPAQEHWGTLCYELQSTSLRDDFFGDQRQRSMVFWAFGAEDELFLSYHSVEDYLFLGYQRRR